MSGLEEDARQQPSPCSTTSREALRLRCCEDCINYVWVSSANTRARKRLGKKISYIGLYDNCHLIDKHEQEIAEMKLRAEYLEQMVCMQEQAIEKRKLQLSKLEKEIEQLKFA